MSTTTMFMQSTPVEGVPSPPDLPNVAIIGRAGSGKTTGAEYLASQYGYRRLSFATLLKLVAAEIWGSDAKTDRSKLQLLGVAVREIDPDAWVNALMYLVDNCVAPIVVDDCRFPNEHAALAERGFEFIRVQSPEDLRVHRLQANGKFQNREQLEHVSETSLDDIKPDAGIQNIGELHMYHLALDRIIDRMRVAR